jgi:hypothetical protein
MESEVLALDPLFHDREDAPAVEAWERAGLWNGCVNAFGAVCQEQERVRGHVRKVDRQYEAEIRGRSAKPGSETDHRRPDVTPIVHDGKGKRQLVSSLADGDHALAGRSEDTVRTLRQGLALEAYECFWGSEAPARSADEEDPCYAVTRQGSE